jgi:hypothetical protein
MICVFREANTSCWSDNSDYLQLDRRGTIVSSVMNEEISVIRQQIADADKQMIQGVFLIVALMIGAFIGAETTGKATLYKLVFVLAVTMTFWVARGDYLIHRAGAYIKNAEIDSGYDWQTYLKSLKSRMLMFPIDLLAASGLVWVLYRCYSELSRFGEKQFAVLCVLGVVGGILATVLLVQLAHKRW